MVKRVLINKVIFLLTIFILLAIVPFSFASDNADLAVAGSDLGTDGAVAIDVDSDDGVAQNGFDNEMVTYDDSEGMAAHDGSDVISSYDDSDGMAAPENMNDENSLKEDDYSSKFVYGEIRTNKSSTVYKSISKAIGEANGGPLTVYIGEGVYKYSSTAGEGIYAQYNARLIISNQNLVFIGAGENTIIDGDIIYYLFRIKNSNISFYNITFTNGEDTAINCTGCNLNIDNCIFLTNYGFRGGVLNSTLSNISISNSLFLNNFATKGGAIHSVNDTLTIVNCSFDNNIAEAGGAIRLAEDNLTLLNSSFYNNTATFPDEWGNGGAIQLIYTCRAEINNTNFTANTADSFGGAISIDSGHLTAYQCIFINNTGDGSAIGNYGPHNDVIPFFVNLTNSIIISNDTEDYIILNQHNLPDSLYIENNWWGSNRVPYVHTDISSIAILEAYIGDDDLIHIGWNKLSNGEDLIGELPVRELLLLPSENFENPVVNLTSSSLDIAYNGNIREDVISIVLDNQVLYLNYNITKSTPDMELEDKTAYLGHEDTIQARIFDGDFPITQGFVHFYIGDELVSSSKIINGYANFTITPTEELNSSIKAVFEGDELFNPVNVTAAYNVVRMVVNVTPVSGNNSLNIQRTINMATDGDIINLGENLNLSDLANIRVNRSVIITGENITLSDAADADSIFYIVSKSLGGPDSVEFRGLNCMFSKEDSKFIVADCDEYCQLNLISAINVNNCSFSVDDSISPKGISILTVSSNSSGFYPTSQIVVTNNTLISGMSPFVFLGNIYDGGDVVIPKASPIATVMTLEAICTSSSGDYNIAVLLKDIHGEIIANTPVDYSISGVDYKNYTDSDGKMIIGDLKFGDLLFVYYTGDDSYLASNLTVNLGHDKKESTIIQCDNMTTSAVVIARTGEYFTARLLDSKGNPLADKKVQIGFNGKIYERTTNESGEFRLQVNLANAGGYTFAISFLGDDDYEASFAVAKITVNKLATKLTTKKYTYKSTNSNKVLSATLTLKNGSALSGKTLKFVVNGVSYSAKTNSKGVASVKVSLTTKKTYDYYVSFAGDSSCEALVCYNKLVIAGADKAASSTVSKFSS